MIPPVYKEITVPHVYRDKASSHLFKEEKASPAVYRKTASYDSTKDA